MAIKVTFRRNGKILPISSRSSEEELQAKLNSSLAFVYGKGLAKTYKKIREKQITIAAIFFQRLCARTPLDDRYKNSDGVWHNPDKDYTRYHWFIMFNDNTRVYSSDMGRKLFENYNDPKSISAIYDYIDKSIGPDTLLSSFKVGNDTNPEKFKLLEYGGYPDSEEIKVDKKGNKHGVENSHSVQAPVGMLRITKAELDRIAKTPSVRDDAYRYARQVSHKIPTERELNKMIAFMRRSHVSTEDIKSYL